MGICHIKRGTSLPHNQEQAQYVNDNCEKVPLEVGKTGPGVCATLMRYQAWQFQQRIDDVVADVVNRFDDSVLHTSVSQSTSKTVVTCDEMNLMPFDLIMVEMISQPAVEQSKLTKCSGAGPIDGQSTRAETKSDVEIYKVDGAHWRHT